jgi:hypothetical protein
MQRQIFSIVGVSMLVVSFGCGSQGSGTATGSGGHAGNTSAAGGSTSAGNGGSATTGGLSGTGGKSGSGGATSGSSGGSGSGGSSTAGRGGSATNGGGSGGTTSPGGTTGAGGTIGAGGTTAAGGTSGGTAGKGSGGLAAGGTSGGSTGGTTGGTTAKGTGGTPTPTSGNGGTTGSDAGTAQGTGGTPVDGGTSQWPQCFGTDTVPTTPLKQRAPSSDYTTQVAYGGLAMLMGSSRQSCLTDTVVNFDIQDLNQEIKDIVETVKFYGFLDWKRGYYLNWIILNSGVTGATMSGQGGGQGDRYGHMDFECTEECPCNWGSGDDANRGDALHECIHALQAELWAFNNQASGWVHEAHNVYSATMRAMLVENKYSEGWGTALTLQMPHGPIESMGMNTDGSWAGPSDQNAKTYVNSINRYGLEIFWLVVNREMGQGFINCTWDSASKSGQPDNRISGPLSVFQAMQKGSSAEAISHVIQRFGARSAILDFDGWTSAMRSNMQGNWKSSYWYYTFPASGDGTTAFSPPTIQIPHHQGRNVIPIKVASGATSVTVSFTPDATGSKGTAAQMQAQLVYRDSSDKPVYGDVFSSGQSTIQITNGVRNSLVDLVVAVVNPNGTSSVKDDDGSGKGFDGSETFNYNAQIISGGTIALKTTTPW